MKKKIVVGIVLMFVVGMLTIPASADVNAIMQRQAKAHEIAEIARELGLPEDDPIIKRASAIWWEADAEKQAELAEQAKPKMTYMGRYKITGYDDCYRCNGRSDRLTASGTTLTLGRTIAAPKNFAFGTRLYIDGIGERVVEDRGGAINGNHIDVYVSSHAEANQITGYYDVYIVEG